MTTATLTPNPKFQGFASNGDPLSGGHLYTYATGTSTPLSTYPTKADAEAGTNANANPVVLDSRGEANVWLVGTQLYRFTLTTSADAAVWGPIEGIGSTLVSSLSGANGSSMIGFLQAGAGAVARTVQDKERDVVSVKDFGAVGNGTNDDTAAIQAAIDSVAGNGRAIYFPPGVYKVTSTITVGTNRTHLQGAGRWATEILFAPTVDDTCIEFSAGAAVLYQCSLSGITIYSADSTYTKVGIELIDVSAFDLHDVIVHGSIASGGTTYWSGGTGSKGLSVKGREAIFVRGFEGYCDRPITIEDNPNSTIDLDQSHFSDLYLTANGNPCIEVFDGVNISTCTFDGAQAWVKGAAGFRWIDTSSSTSSQQLTIRNARWEQATSATGHIVELSLNTSMNGLVIDNCSGGLNALGFKLRTVSNARIANSATLNTSGNSIDVDSTVQPFILDNVFVQTGGTVSVGTLVKVFDAGSSTLPSSSKNFAIYALPTVKTAANFNIPICGSAVSVAQDATTVLAVANDFTGYVSIITSEDVIARFVLTGATHTVTEMDDYANAFTVTKDNAGTWNVYYETDNYLIQNKRAAGTKTVKWLLIGDNI